jgi:hypothetical protein
MKIIKKAILITLALIVLSATQSSAQQLEVVFKNAGMGAATGAGLGVATMALQNSKNYRPVTFGIGAGVLGGVGIGIYDMLDSSGNGRVQGIFHTTQYTTGIIFLDALYGAGAGGLIGMAVALMGETNIALGLQYGAGAGAWVGFGFGLIDAFYYAKQNRDRDFFDYDNISTLNQGYTPAPGFISVYERENTSLSLINPIMIEKIIPGQESKITYGVELVRWHLRF